MNSQELICKNAWVYYCDDWRNILNTEQVNNTIQIDKDIYLCNITNVIYNEFTLEDVTKELNNNNIEQAKNIVEILKDNLVIEQRSQIIALEDLKIVILICDDIKSWEKKLSFHKFNEMEVVSKNILKLLVEKQIAGSVLSLAVGYDNSNNMINAFNIHGSNIQNSDQFLDVLMDSDTKILNCVFQPTYDNYLVTLRKKNKIEVSKYVSSSQQLSFLIKFCKFISLNNYGLR